MTAPSNICGGMVAKLRRKRGLTQGEFARKCRAAGWPVARSVLAKVENRSRSVSDRELVSLARALGVNVLTLLRTPAREKPTRKTPRGNKPRDNA